MTGLDVLWIGLGVGSAFFLTAFGIGLFLALKSLTEKNDDR